MHDQNASFAREAPGGELTHLFAALHRPAALLKTGCAVIPVIAFHTLSIVSNPEGKVNTDLCFRLLCRSA